MVTMKDIARAAGVSHGTVSNVLNKTGKVSIEKIRLVEEAAKKLGYVQNTQAQNLRLGNATAIALIVPSLKDDAALELYTSLNQSLKPNGYDVLIYVTDEIEKNEEEILHKLPFSSLAAIVAISSFINTSPEKSPYAVIPCPVIFVNRCRQLRRPGDCYISFENEIISKDLLGYILKGKYKNVVFFSSYGDFSYTNVIFERVIDELKEKNICAELYCSEINYSLAKAFDILAMTGSSDIVITNNKLRSDVLINVIGLLGKKDPPKIVSLCSSSNFPNELLTVYRFDFNRIGERISELLIASLENKSVLPGEQFVQTRGFMSQAFSGTKVRFKKRTLSLLTIDSPSTTALKKLAPLFKKASGIDLKIIGMPYNDIPQQISLLDENCYYDMVRMDIVQFDTYGTSTYIPLRCADIDSKKLSERMIINTFINKYLTGGNEYILPFDPSALILLYRKNLFEDAILSRAFYEKYHQKLSVPTTMEEYVKITEFFSRKTNAISPTLYGATATTGSASVASSDFYPYLLAEFADADVTSEPIRKEKTINAINTYLKVAANSSRHSWWSDSLGQFLSGQSATTIVYSNFASEIVNSDYSDTLGKIGAAVVPGGHPLLGGGFLGISKFSKSHDLCGEFFNWFYSEEVISLMVNLGGVSPLLETYTDTRYFTVFPWFPTAKKNFELSSRGLYKNDKYTMSQVEFAIGTAIRNVLSNIMSVEDAYDFIKPYLTPAGE